VARGPKVASQASKRGPRPVKELKEKCIFKNCKHCQFNRIYRNNYSPL